MIIVACPCSQPYESGPQPNMPDEPPQVRNTPEPWDKMAMQLAEMLCGQGRAVVESPSG